MKQPNKTQQEVLVMPGQPANYPRLNALSDIYDCLRTYVKNLPNTTDGNAAMRFIAQQSHQEFMMLRIYTHDAVVSERKTVLPPDALKRLEQVQCLEVINATHGKPGEAIHDTVRNLTTLYQAVYHLDADDWTDSVWATVEQALNDAAGYYHPQQMVPCAPSTQVTDYERTTDGR